MLFAFDAAQRELETEWLAGLAIFEWEAEGVTGDILITRAQSVAMEWLMESLDRQWIQA